MKKVLFNGKVYVEKDKFAQAVLFEDEIIKKVGTNEEVLAAAGDCEKIDCGGRTVIPGLNDSHQHITMIADRLASVNIMGCESIDEVIQRCKDFIKTNPESTKKGLIGTGWNQDLFTSGEVRYLNRHDLDKISTEIPISLARICGHILAANTKAIEMAGLGIGSPQIEGGTFEVEEDGYPTGFFSEFACNVINETIPQRRSYEEMKDLVLKAMEYQVSKGLTSVQTNDIGQCQLGDEETFRLIREIYGEGLGKVRYHHQLCFRTLDDFKAYLASDERKDEVYKKDTWLTLGPLKLFKDGSLGARTATTREEYCDDPGNFGVEAMSDELVDEIVGIAHNEGMQVVTHAIGDDAIEKMLNSYEKVTKGGENKLRHSIVHYQCMDLPMIERTAKLGVYAQIQPIFLTTDIHAVGTRFSPELNRYFIAIKTDLEKGVNVSFGSDSPVEDCNPMLSIYCAVTRKDVKGNPENGFHPEECISVSDAVDCFTMGSAKVQFQENVKGRIKEGMLADMVILDKDIFTIDPSEIKDTESYITIVGGKTVYQAK